MRELEVFRICRKAYAAHAYDGTGAARAGARWNSRGVFVAYASSSLSLCQLEYLVHVGRELAPTDLVVVRARVPEDGVSDFELKKLPADWRKLPPPRTLKEIGDGWVRAKRSLALRVPSAIVPSEANLLIDPRHPRFGEIAVQKPVPLQLDPRLFKPASR